MEPDDEVSPFCRTLPNEGIYRRHHFARYVFEGGLAQL